MTGSSWSYQLGADVNAPRAARHALGAFEDQVEPPLYEDLLLLVTELVTNGVRHAGVTASDLLTVDVSLTDETVRVEVSDPGAGFEPPPPAPRAADAGWGLFLVDRVADRWGVVGDVNNNVWFEIDRPAVGAAR